MRALICHSTLTVLVLALTASAAGGQQIFTAQPISPDDPRAQRVAGLVQLILAGDEAAALAHATEHAAPTLRESSGFETDLRGLVAEFGTGDFLIEALNQLEREVIAARLRNTSGGPPAAILVGVEPDAPHRITRLGTRRMQLRRPAD